MVRAVKRNILQSGKLYYRSKGAITYFLEKDSHGDSFDHLIRLFQQALHLGLGRQADDPEPVRERRRHAQCAFPDGTGTAQDDDVLGGVAH